MNDLSKPIIRQDSGQGAPSPICSSRDEENAKNLIKLYHDLEQPVILDWPLMTPIKVPMLKCKKCSLEFCSSLNYKRHIRVHRQSSATNKEYSRNKDLLAAFWDKLSVERAEKVVSFDEIMFKGTPGPSLLDMQASFLFSLAVLTLPNDYAKAGSLLLNTIKSKRLISSTELFFILDNASERTFLRGETTENVQNYLFGGEASKIPIEFKDLVACTSFLLEQQLVKAWVTFKDAEALRCHKLLLEEEETANKRLAKLSQKKKQKKLRRKEHKHKKLSQQYESDLNVTTGATSNSVLMELSHQYERSLEVEVDGREISHLEELSHKCAGDINVTVDTEGTPVFVKLSHQGEDLNAIDDNLNAFVDAACGPVLAELPHLSKEDIPVLAGVSQQCKENIDVDVDAVQSPLLVELSHNVVVGSSHSLILAKLSKQCEEDSNLVVDLDESTVLVQLSMPSSPSDSSPKSRHEKLDDTTKNCGKMLKPTMPDEATHCIPVVKTKFELLIGSLPVPITLPAILVGEIPIIHCDCDIQDYVLNNQQWCPRMESRCNMRSCDIGQLWSCGPFFGFN